jgi:hypothetical protein
MGIKKVSIETVHSLFKLHGYSPKLFERPQANSVIQQLIDKGSLSEQNLAQLKSSARVDIFLSLKTTIIEQYGDNLSDDDLFAVLETLDALSFLVSDTDGLNLPLGPVMAFLQQNISFGDHQFGSFGNKTTKPH